MAVIDLIPGLTVTVKVDGRTAQEYEGPRVETDFMDLTHYHHAPMKPGPPNPPHVIKYIEAIPGAFFKIRISGGALPQPEPPHCRQGFFQRSNDAPTTRDSGW